MAVCFNGNAPFTRAPAGCRVRVRQRPPTPPRAEWEKTRSVKASHAKQTRKDLSGYVNTPCWRDRNAPDWGTLTVSHSRSDTSQAPLTRPHGDQHIVEDRCLHHARRSSSQKNSACRPDRVLEVAVMEVQASLCELLEPMLKKAPTAIRSLRGSSPGWSRAMRREELVRMVCTETSGVAWSSRPGRMRRPARADTASRRGVPGEGLRAGSRQGRRAGTCASRWRARGREGRGGGVSWAGP